MRNPKVCVLRSAGTNCDQETAAAFKMAGAQPELLHINSLVSLARSLDDFHILALPGGFSHGDDVASGKIFANELRFKLVDSLRKFIADGKLIIGICNGFQILVKSGLLPGFGGSNQELKQEVSLILNDSAKFESRWVYLKPAGNCVWTRGLKKIIYLPVAHGEGKFVAADKRILNRLKQNKQIVFQYSDSAGNLSGYPDNPNGSMESIAGICDETGRVFGLMPHPERHIYAAQHPRKEGRSKEADGFQIFKNGVNFIKKNF
ncbi:MAG TPA: phosphoribosylformylglycinamidine synthase I [Candidatus Omnitrophota bacterium]|nr:phosphoribosylformylglycinamidine synthase I [Candidatus Omnitrophota bacterium]HPT39910.1 phosphoribosylformylglycinamidine synthase I [Candidatus Omnitrophota bacterium]